MWREDIRLEGRYRGVAPRLRWGLGRCVEVEDTERGGAHLVVKQLVEAVRLPGAREQVDVAFDQIERIGHTNVVATRGRGWCDDAPYLLLEDVDGCALGELVDGWRAERWIPTHAEVRAVVEQVASALAWTHSFRAPMPHGCLTAESVLVEASAAPPWEVKVTDFGLGPFAAAQTFEFVSRSLVDARAPEVRAGAAPTVAADVYALGVLLWSMLTPWETSFGQGAREERLRRSTAEAHAWLRGQRPDVHPSVWSIVLRCLDASPHLRPHNADDLGRLLAMADWSPTAALTARWPDPPTRRPPDGADARGEAIPIERVWDRAHRERVAASEARPTQGAPIASPEATLLDERAPEEDAPPAVPAPKPARRARKREVGGDGDATIALPRRSAPAPAAAPPRDEAPDQTLPLGDVSCVDETVVDHEDRTPRTSRRVLHVQAPPAYDETVLMPPLADRVAATVPWVPPAYSPPPPAIEKTLEVPDARTRPEASGASKARIRGAALALIVVAAVALLLLAVRTFSS